MSHLAFLRLCAFLIFAPLCAALPGFDFSQAEVRREWRAAHDVQLDTDHPSALIAQISGADPYFIGPVRDYPANQPLWLLIDIHSEQGGPAQIFWFDSNGPAEERSIRFHVPARSNLVLHLPMPPLGPGTRLRIDPPGDRGRCAVASIRFQLRPALDPVEWRRAVPPRFPPSSESLRAGPIRLRHSPAGPGAFTLDVDGQAFAIGHAAAPIGYQINGQTRWFTWDQPMVPGPRLRRQGRNLTLESRHRDPDNAVWTFRQVFTAHPDHLAYTSTVSIDQDRDVVLVPGLVLLPGVRSFGTNKHQALLAGVEYLANEESSSERDLIGPQARRQVADPIKFTFPLMAIAASNRWLSVAWSPQPDLAVLHDTPDRISHSGGHLIGLIHPGADPAIREDGSLLPYRGQLLRSGQILQARAAIQAGRGSSVVPAIQAHVKRTGLPPLPQPVASATDFYRLAARGWLDSGIRDGARYRHAVGGPFQPGIAADAGFHQRWLASRVQDAGLESRLREAAAANAAQVPDTAWIQGQIGHLRSPAPALTALKGPETAAQAREIARRELDRLGPDTRIEYRVSPGSIDLGRTHWEREANGLTAQHLLNAFESALWSGNPALVQECLGHLRRLDRYDLDVPRGAQTWEVPLHTPDILASAHLVRLYVLGYELTGETSMLDRARYWAWTGVSFIYLSPVGPGPVHVFSTTPVLGATQFIAPNWIGLPVQWCGLVFAEAVLRLAPHDTSLDWHRLAVGIGLAGVQHTHPESDESAMGCLPDSFDLRAQARNPVPINPATLTPIAAIAYGEKPFQGFASARKAAAWIIAAGPIRILREDPNQFSCEMDLPDDVPSHVVLGGVSSDARIHANGRPIVPVNHSPCIIELRGFTRLDVSR